MGNPKAKTHVKKGMFALFSGLVLLVLYQKWNVTGWLGEKDNVFLTMIVVIVPLMATTEMIFMGYQLIKDKWENIMN